ncbi:hypothetical protein [Actinopolyspora saharensis]|uniref:Uncharacterized protein n=1 Tax=Actinopolyspora saharensis TaxID=995062 RepID=A0A1H1GRH3_9ACTN|nr:hypothetical protein [Actinopolyspora saharensis]SDR15794.1 hypothetical protein SAMN04489718_3822 [Actinopolyspora saharensis]
MNNHDVADDDPERRGTPAPGAVGTAALLGFNLVLLVRALRRITRQDVFEVVAASEQPGAGEVLLRILLYCFAGAVVVGHLWFTARALRLCGFSRPGPTLLVSIGASAVLIPLSGVLLRSPVGPNPVTLAEVPVYPLVAAAGHALVARFAPRVSEAPRPPLRASWAAVVSAVMLGVNFVLVAWTVLRFGGLAVLGMAMSPQQESWGLVLSLYCVLAAVLVVQAWFLGRMMRLSGITRPVPMLLLAVGVSAALGVLAGMVLWALWEQWEVLVPHAVAVALFALLAAAGFGVTAWLARRTRVLAVLAVVAPVVVLGGAFALAALRSGALAG